MKKIISAMFLLSGLLTGCALEESPVIIPLEVIFCDENPNDGVIGDAYDRIIYRSRLVEDGFVFIDEFTYKPANCGLFEPCPDGWCLPTVCPNEQTMCYNWYFEKEMPRSNYSDNYLRCFDKCMEIPSLSARNACITSLGESPEC